MNPQRQKQISTLLAGTEFESGQLEPLPCDASFRRYIRVSKGNKTAMLMDAPPDKEDVRPFVLAAEYLVQQSFSAPVILAKDIEAGLLLLEDLGDASYTRILQSLTGDEYIVKERQLYIGAIDVLVDWHDRSKGFSDPQAFNLPLYDVAELMREVGLFSEWFLPQIVGRDAGRTLAQEYMQLWETVFTTLMPATDIWVHRDYHADNLMWLPSREGVKRVGLLDFQDGLYGDAVYDLVSLLEDARRDVSPQLAEEMIVRYIERSGVDEQNFRARYALIGAQRNSKIIGIFTRLAARDGKAKYLDYLPRVWKHLEHDLEHSHLASLKQWVDAYIPLTQRGIIPLRYYAEELDVSA